MQEYRIRVDYTNKKGKIDNGRKGFQLIINQLGLLPRHLRDHGKQLIVRKARSDRYKVLVDKNIKGKTAEIFTEGEIEILEKIGGNNENDT